MTTPKPSEYDDDPFVSDSYLRYNEAPYVDIDTDPVEVVQFVPATEDTSGW